MHDYFDNILIICVSRILLSNNFPSILIPPVLSFSIQILFGLNFILILSHQRRMLLFPVFRKVILRISPKLSAVIEKTMYFCGMQVNYEIDEGGIYQKNFVTSLMKKS